MSKGAMQSRISVAVRVRGLNAEEADDGSAFYTVDNSVVCNSMAENSLFGNGISKAPTGKAYTFDKVYDEKSANVDVYESSAAGLVPRLFSGYNVTILAYGQTGSGKTHTMGTNFTGNEREEQLGVIPRVSKDILERMAVELGAGAGPVVDGDIAMEGCSKGAVEAPKLSGTFVELYNEVIRDLLLPDSMGQASTGLPLVKDSFGNYMAKGATELELHSMEDLAHILRLGALRRATGSTKMNANSSRSHAVFTLKLEQWVPSGEGAEGAMVKKVSLFRLVDLAGSERVGQTGATGMRLKEGANINKSLQCLGQCIVALADGAPHVPFRNSKLTQLLMNSLGGNSATVMIACVSPANRNFSQSLNTLDYATRASRIVNKLTMNVDPTAALTMELRSEVAMLVDELTRLYAAGTPVTQPVLERFNIGGAATVQLPALQGVKKAAPSIMRSQSAHCVLSTAAAADTSSTEATHAELRAMRRQVQELQSHMAGLEQENNLLRCQAEDAIHMHASMIDECERLRIINDELNQGLRESQAVVGDYWQAVTLIRQELNKENGDAETLSTELSNLLACIKHHPSFGVQGSPAAKRTREEGVASDDPFVVIQRQEQEIMRLRQELFEASSNVAMPQQNPFDGLQFDSIDVEAIARGEFQFVSQDDPLFVAQGQHAGTKRTAQQVLPESSAPMVKRMRRAASLCSVYEDQEADEAEEGDKEETLEDEHPRQVEHDVRHQMNHAVLEDEEARQLLANMLFEAGKSEVQAEVNSSSSTDVRLRRLLYFPEHSSRFSDEDRLFMESELDKQRRAAALQADNHAQQAIEKQALIEAKELEVEAVQRQVETEHAANGGKTSDALHKKLQDLQQEIRALKAERLRLVEAAKSHEQRAEQIKALQNKLNDSRAQQVRLQKELRDKQDLSRKEREEGKRMVQKAEREFEREKKERQQLQRTVTILQNQLQHLAQRFVATKNGDDAAEKAEVKVEHSKASDAGHRAERRGFITNAQPASSLAPGIFSEHTHNFTVPPIPEANILLGDSSIPRGDPSSNNDRRNGRREPLHYIRRKITGGRRVAALTHRILWFRINDRRMENELERVSNELQDVSARMRSLPDGDAELVALSQLRASLQAKREGMKSDLLALRDAERVEGLDDMRWLSKLIGASRPRYIARHLDAAWAKADHLPAGAHVNMAHMHMSPQPREIVTYLMNSLVQLSYGMHSGAFAAGITADQAAATEVVDEDELDEVASLQDDDLILDFADIQPDVAAGIVRAVAAMESTHTETRAAMEAAECAATVEPPVDATAHAQTEVDDDDDFDDRPAHLVFADKSKAAAPPLAAGRSSVYMHTQSSRAKRRQLEEARLSSLNAPVAPPALPKPAPRVSRISDENAAPEGLQVVGGKNSKVIVAAASRHSTATVTEDLDEMDIFPKEAGQPKRSFGAHRTIANA